MYRIFLGQSVVPANVPVMYGTVQAASKPKNGTVRWGSHGDMMRIDDGNSTI